ncbi:hypothetical protein [Fulvimarina sp. MAC8]|uniref:DUF4760 domain-containing protein n=1 Tax=Fulvimarina sp. MAC8 TaxID=3162874 RepID=UPI0032EE3EBA
MAISISISFSDKPVDLISSGTAILIGAAFATLGVVFTQRASRKLEKQRRAFEMILKHEDSAQLSGAFAEARIYIEFYKHKCHGPMPEDVIKGVEYLLNHYEYVSSAVWCGDLDEKLMFQSERSRFIAIVQNFDDLIAIKRSTILGEGSNNTPSVWSNLTRISRRWDQTRGPRSTLQIALEWWVMRPVRMEEFWGRCCNVIKRMSVRDYGNSKCRRVIVEKTEILKKSAEGSYYG